MSAEQNRLAWLDVEREAHGTILMTQNTSPMRMSTPETAQHAVGAGVGEAIAYIHDGMHVFADESYVKLFQFSDLDEVLATPFMDMVTEECRKDLKLSLRLWQQASQTTDDTQIARLEVMALDANKVAFPVDLCLRPTFYEGENCLQVVITTKQPQPVAIAAIRKIVTKSRQDAVADALNKELPSQESIASALANNSLVLVYHPVMSTTVLEPEFYDIHPHMYGADQQVCSAEQITRAVGNTALGQQLDRWVSACAIRLLGNIASQGKTQQFQLTITAQTIQDPDFAEWLVSQLNECSVDARALVLNIREGDILMHKAEAIALINGLHYRGLRVCISGYTNHEEIASIVSQCGIGLVRFDNDISEADSPNMLSLEELKNLVNILHKDAVKVIAADVQDKETIDCLWLADVDLVQGAWFENEAQELQAGSCWPETPVMDEVV